MSCNKKPERNRVFFRGKRYMQNVWKVGKALVMLCGVEITFHLKKKIDLSQGTLVLSAK